MTLPDQIQFLVTTQGETAAKLWLRHHFRNPEHLPEFAAFLFPHYVTSAIPKFHLDLYEAFSSSLFYNENVARAAPRGSAKSTVVGVVLLAWIGIYRLRRFIAYISSTATQAEGLLAPLQHEFEGNERLLWLYGDLRSPALWNKTDFVLSTGVRFVAKGAGMKIRGIRFMEYRPDLIVFDDLEDDKEVINPLNRKKLKNWFLAAALSALEPEGGIAWVVGTVLHPDALLQNILEGKPPFNEWNAAVFKALRPDGESFWPMRFPKEWLEQKRRELGTLVFNQEYQNEPIQEGIQLCPPGYIRNIDRSFEFKPEYVTRYLACDPAVSKKETANKTAIVGGEAIRLPNGDVLKIRVTYANASRMSALETAQKLKDVDGALSPRVIGIESVAYQQSLVEITEKLGLPIRAMKADADKIRRFNRISPYMEQGLVEIDPALAELIAQLLNFTGAEGGEDDLVDAFVYFVTLCIEKQEEAFQVFVG